MSGKQDWVWHELMTTDIDAASRFYGEVVGWKISEFPGPEGAPRYLVGNVGQRGVVGFMGMPPGVPSGMPASWAGYLYTDDADAMVGKVKAAGGSVLRAPWDIPTVGRIAVCADPEGGMFNVMKPGRDDAPPKLEQNTPGNVSWCELHSTDENNIEFYIKLFGWEKTEAMDMGEHGIYQMFTTNENPSTGGSVRKAKGSPEESLPTYWLFYFSVDGMDAAIQRVAAGGGHIFMGPHQVPGGSWIAMGKDPQGATFAIHSQSK